MPSFLKKAFQTNYTKSSVNHFGGSAMRSARGFLREQLDGSNAYEATNRPLILVGYCFDGNVNYRSSDVVQAASLSVLKAAVGSRRTYDAGMLSKINSTGASLYAVIKSLEAVIAAASIPELLADSTFTYLGHNNVEDWKDDLDKLYPYTAIIPVQSDMKNLIDHYLGLRFEDDGTAYLAIAYGVMLNGNSVTEQMNCLGGDWSLSDLADQCDYICSVPDIMNLCGDLHAFANNYIFGYECEGKGEGSLRTWKEHTGAIIGITPKFGATDQTGIPATRLNCKNVFADSILVQTAQEGYLSDFVLPGLSMSTAADGVNLNVAVAFALIGILTASSNNIGTITGSLAIDPFSNGESYADNARIFCYLQGDRRLAPAFELFHGDDLILSVNAPDEDLYVVRVMATDLAAAEIAYMAEKYSKIIVNTQEKSTDPQGKKKQPKNKSKDKA